MYYYYYYVSIVFIVIICFALMINRNQSSNEWIQDRIKIINKQLGEGGLVLLSYKDKYWLTTRKHSGFIDNQGPLAYRNTIRVNSLSAYRTLKIIKKLQRGKSGSFEWALSQFNQVPWKDKHTIDLVDHKRWSDNGK